MTTQPYSESFAVHVFFPTKEEAKQEAFRQSAPFFTTWKNGQLLYSIRVKVEVR